MTCVLAMDMAVTLLAAGDPFEVWWPPISTLCAVTAGSIVSWSLAVHAAFWPTPPDPNVR